MNITRHQTLVLALIQDMTERFSSRSLRYVVIIPPLLAWIVLVPASAISPDLRGVSPGNWHRFVPILLTGLVACAPDAGAKHPTRDSYLSHKETLEAACNALLNDQRKEKTILL